MWNMQSERVLGTACSIRVYRMQMHNLARRKRLAKKGRIFGQGLNEFELKEDQIYAREIWVFIS